MNEQLFFNRLITVWSSIALLVFVTLFFVAAPYGRHHRQGWGPAIDSRLSWFVMESMAPVMFAVWFFLGTNLTITTVIFLGLWEAHYIHRAFIFPIDLRTSENRMPVAVLMFALIFNATNTYLNGRYIFTFSDRYTNGWLTSPYFIIGVAIFLIGFVINRHADMTLRNLRKPGETTYGIPRGGLYRWISCPNYFGEIIIWTGWAIATWSLAGLSFAIWTAANLAPRARSHHRWYKSNFPEYPSERKALLPGLW